LTVDRSNLKPEQWRPVENFSSAVTGNAA